MRPGSDGSRPRRAASSSLPNMASSSAGVAGRWVPVATSSVTRSGGVGISSRMARSMGIRGWALVGSHTEMATVAPSGTRSASGGAGVRGSERPHDRRLRGRNRSGGETGPDDGRPFFGGGGEREIEPGLSVVEWDPHGFRVFSPDAPLPLRHALRRRGRSPHRGPAAADPGPRPRARPGRSGGPRRGRAERTAPGARRGRRGGGRLRRTPAGGRGPAGAPGASPQDLVHRTQLPRPRRRSRREDHADARRVHAAERLHHRPGRHGPPAPGVAAGHRRGRTGARAGAGPGRTSRRRTRGRRSAPARWRWT